MSGTAKTSIRILIVDDHTVVRAGLRQIISEAEEMEVVAEAASAREALEKVASEELDLVLLDVSLPDKNGLEVLKQIKAAYPTVRVLLLSMHAEDQYGIRALKAGASGYLTKESAPEQLIAALRKVSQGGKYITPALAEQIVYSFESDANNPPHENLSDREYEVMCLIASGKTVTEIAEQLFLSVKTVSTYRARVLEKMHLKNNSELTSYAIKNRLVN
jgi:two-component system, NarL family, invasion response regulator UvrY